MAQLTSGSIMSIASGKVDLKPTVQVIDINKIVSNQSGGQDRYRLILSDGQHFQQAMLATNLNGLVVQQEIVNLCTVRLVDFICKPIKERRILIVLNIEMVGGPEAKVGAPVSVDVALAGGATAAPAATPAAAPSHLKAHPMEISRAAQTVEAGQLAGQTILPISGLNPYQNKWTIRARVTKKNHRPYTNNRGSGTLINVDLLDSEGGEIRATAFNEVAERMNAVFEENKVFLVSMGEVKFANKRFNPLNNDYEITMNSNSVVELSQDDPSIPQVQYNFVPIAGIEDIPKDRNVDIIGALLRVEEIGSITTKNNDTLNKRIIVLADDSNASINATLWGQRAEEFNLPTGTIVAVKGARVGDYGGRTLSVNSNSTFAPNPDIPEAFKQKGWYDDCAGQGVRSLSSTYTAGGSSAPLESVNLSEIPARVSSGTTFKLKTIGSITYVPSNNDLWYEACPGPDPKDPNRLCNKKIFKTNTQYVCDKCDGSFEKPNLRYICSFKMSDFSGEQWMTAFNEVAEQVLGMDAEAMKNLKENGDDASYRRALTTPQFNTYSLRCNASLDTNGDNGPRIRCTIQGVAPLNYVQQSWDLLKTIKKLEAM